MEARTVEAEYQNLAKSGKIAPEQKKHFLRIAKNEGLEFARDVYNAKEPMFQEGEVLKLVETEENNERLKETYKQLGLSDDEIKAHFKIMEQRERTA